MPLGLWSVPLLLHAEAAACYLAPDSKANNSDSPVGTAGCEGQAQKPADPEISRLLSWRPGQAQGSLHLSPCPLP